MLTYIQEYISKEKNKPDTKQYKLQEISIYLRLEQFKNTLIKEGFNYALLLMTDNKNGLSRKYFNSSHINF